jgi:hypothetical protein
MTSGSVTRPLCDSAKLLPLFFGIAKNSERYDFLAPLILFANSILAIKKFTKLGNISDVSATRQANELRSEIPWYSRCHKYYTFSVNVIGVLD